MIQNRRDGHWDGKEDVEISPKTFKCLMFDKGIKTKYRKDSLFNSWC